jgi:hypothetical protein
VGGVRAKQEVESIGLVGLAVAAVLEDHAFRRRQLAELIAIQRSMLFLRRALSKILERPVTIFTGFGRRTSSWYLTTTFALEHVLR